MLLCAYRLLPAGAALPQGGSLPKPEKQGSGAEHGAVLDALRAAMLAISELLVPDYVHRTALLTGAQLWYLCYDCHAPINQSIKRLHRGTAEGDAGRRAGGSACDRRAARV